MSFDFRVKGSEGSRIKSWRFVKLKLHSPVDGKIVVTLFNEGKGRAKVTVKDYGRVRISRDSAPAKIQVQGLVVTREGFTVYDNKKSPKFPNGAKFVVTWGASSNGQDLDLSDA